MLDFSNVPGFQGDIVR